MHFLSQQSELNFGNVCLKLNNIFTDKYALTEGVLLQVITIDQEIYSAYELASFDETTLWLLGRSPQHEEIVRLLFQVGAIEWNKLPRVNFFSKVLVLKDILKSDANMRQMFDFDSRIKYWKKSKWVLLLNFKLIPVVFLDELQINFLLLLQKNKFYRTCNY